MTLRCGICMSAWGAEKRLMAMLQSARDIIDDADNRALSASEMLDLLDGWLARHTPPADPGQPVPDPQQRKRS